MSLFFIQYVLFDDFIIIRDHLNPFSPRISWPHAEDGLQIISLLKLIDCTSILFYIPFLNYFTRGVTIAHERLRNLGLWSALFGHWGGRDHREFFIVSLTLLIMTQDEIDVCKCTRQSQLNDPADWWPCTIVDKALRGPRTSQYIPTRVLIGLLKLLINNYPNCI